MPSFPENKKEKIISFLLFLDEKKQKSFDRTELAKNPKLTLKSFNSSPISGVDVLAEFIDISKDDRFLTCSESSPERFFNALTADFLHANYVMSLKCKDKQRLPVLFEPKCFDEIRTI